MILKYNETSHEPDLQHLSRLSLENIPTDAEASQDENQIHKTLLVKNKYDILKAKLDQWKKEDVYTKLVDEGQDCISLRWVLKEKVANGEKLVQTRLCARSFEEEQLFSNRWSYLL